MNNDEKFAIGTVASIMAGLGLMIAGDAWVTQNSFEMFGGIVIALSQIFILGAVIGSVGEEE
jgi:hypothetical protein